MNIQVKALSMSVQVFDNRGVLSPEFKQLFLSCERELQSQMNLSMTHMDMRDFFP